MSKVYRASELAHVWAHAQSDASGTSRGSVRFDGNRFYSFATTIGLKLVTPGGKTIFVLDCASFSPRTSRHQSWLWSAIPNRVDSFSVSIGGWGTGLNYTRTPEDVLEVMKGMAKSAVTKAELEQHRFKYPLYADAARILNDARRFAKLFRIKVGKTAGILPPKAKLEALKKLNDEWNQGVEDRRIKARAEHAVRMRANAERLANQVMSGEIELQRWHDPDLSHNPEMEAAWNNYLKKRDETAIADWLAGYTSLTRKSWPTMLRISRYDPSEIETSRGARVPVDDAKRAFQFCMKFITSGREWRRNGEQFHVGHYQLDSITKEGVIAGCHRFTWSEIERFAKVMGW